MKPFESLTVLIAGKREKADPLGKALTEWGHDISLAVTGSETVKLLDTVAPNVVVIHESIKGMSCEALLDECRRRYPGTAVVVITVNADTEAEQRLVQRGAVCCLPEPADPGQLIARCMPARVNRRQHKYAHTAELPSRGFDTGEGIYRSMVTCMLDGFAFGVIMVDELGIPDDCRFLDMNPAFESISGLKRSELVRMTGKSIFPDFNTRWIERFRTLEPGGDPVRFASYSPVTGSRLHVQAFIPRTGIIAVIITDDARLAGMETELTERQEPSERLYQTQRMEAIGQFAGGIAHDFNNILTTIIGGGQLLLNKLPKESPLRQYAEIVLSSGQKAVQLTESLLTFSRKQDVELKPADINEIIVRTAKLLNRLIGEDIDLHLDLCEGPLVINGDDVQIEQVLMNLATNARDAMPRGGSILIRTERQRLDQGFMNICGRGEPGNYAVISFSDTGAGIPEMHREKVFEPFFTTKPKGKGTGLGLSIVHGIIRQHGGYINLESSLEQRTTFVFYLPLTMAENLCEETSEQAAPVGGSETILLAEDDPTVRSLEKTILEGYGYRVIEAYDGQEAVELFAGHMDEIDMVILDVVMPRKNGSIVYQELQQLCPHVKVLFISGYTADLISRKGIEEKSVNFISKPLTPLALLQKVREVLEMA